LLLRWSGLKQSIKGAASRPRRRRYQALVIDNGDTRNVEDSQQALVEKLPQPQLETPSQQHQQKQGLPTATQQQQQKQKARKSKKCKDILRVIWVQLFENGVGTVGSVYVSCGDVSYLGQVDPRPLKPEPYFAKKWARRRKQQHPEKEKDKDVVLKDFPTPTPA
jgi:hypothetical protein